MKLLFENWRKYLKESYVDDIISTLEKDQEERSARPGRTAQAQKWQKNPSSSDADWDKFKQWKADEENQEHRKAGPEEYEKARKQRSAQKSQDNLAYNCENLKKWLKWV